VQDPNFYVYLDNGKPTLKKTHSNGYYSQIQLAMGLSGIKFCDFIVYTYKGIIIARTQFDKIYFDELLEKLTIFYINYILPKLS